MMTVFHCYTLFSKPFKANCMSQLLNESFRRIRTVVPQFVVKCQSNKIYFENNIDLVPRNFSLTG